MVIFSVIFSKSYLKAFSWFLLILYAVVEWWAHTERQVFWLKPDSVLGKTVRLCV